MSSDDETKSEKSDGDGKGFSLPGEAIEREAAKVLGRLTGDAADGLSATMGNVFGGLVGDRIREWRTRNLLTICRETALRLKAQGVDLDKVKDLPMGQVYMIFKTASEVEDRDLRGLWAVLLSFELSSDKNQAKAQVFQEVLKGISPIDAKVLNLLYTWHLYADYLQFIRGEHIKGGSQSEAWKNKFDEAVAMMSEDVSHHYQALEDFGKQAVAHSLQKITAQALCEIKLGKTSAPESVAKRIFKKKPFSEDEVTSELDNNKVLNTISDIYGALETVSENQGNFIALRSVEKKEVEHTFQLTEFALAFMKACSEVEIASSLGE